MELNTGLNLLLQGLPAIAELLTAMQNERIVQLKQQAEAAGRGTDSKRKAGKLEAQLQLAAYQRETSQALLEHQKVLEQWSLGLFPSQLLDTSPSAGLVPLQIFLAPLTIQLDSRDEHLPGWQSLELTLAQGLADFLNQHYPLSSSERPTELLAGAWREHSLRREARIKALFGQLRDRPTLVLETEIVGEALHVRLACWGLKQSHYCYRPIIADLPWRQLLYTSMKERARRWRRTAEQLLEAGESPETILSLGGDNAHNWEWLEKEAQWQEQGIDTAMLCLPYKFAPEDFNPLNGMLVNIYSVLAAWIADVHHLLHSSAFPLLPGLMAKLTGPIAVPLVGQSLLEAMLSGYQDIFRNLEKERPEAAAQLALKLAHSLSTLSDPTPARQQMAYSLKIWLKQRQGTEETSEERLWPAVGSLLGPADEPYVQSLKACWLALGEKERARQLNELLTSWQGRFLKENPPAELYRCPMPEPARLSLTPARTFSGYSGKAASLVFCQNGEALAIAKENQTITLHHLESGDPLQTLNSKAAGRILAISLSPDGEFLASSHRTCDRSSIRVWHLSSGRLLHSLTGHHKWIYALAISPDSRWLVSGGHKIKIWDLHRGQLRQTLDGHQDWVYGLAISPDGETLISAGADKMIKLWHLPTGKLLHVLPGHSDWVRSLALSSDGQLLASGSDDQTIRLWHTGSAKLLNTLRGHLGGVSSVVISPDRQTLISGSKDNTIRLWQLQSGSLLQTLTEHKKQVHSLAISPDGTTFASGGEDKTIIVWPKISIA